MGTFVETFLQPLKCANFGSDFVVQLHLIKSPKKMKPSFTFALLLFVISLHAQELSFKWKTEPLLPVPESVLFDPGSGMLYVSCIVGKAGEKDGIGSVAKVSTDGKIIAADWVSGLNAPKGMGIYKGHLFVADLTRIVKVELSSGKIVQSTEIEGASFLNDVTIDKKGNVYASDSDKGKIFVLKGEQSEVYFEDPQFKRLNGLLALQDGLYILDAGTGTNYKLTTEKKLSVFGQTSPGADGVELVGKDEYLVSNWNGEVYYVNAKGESKKILDTKEEKLNAADIGFDAKTNTMFVPTFLGNSVTAYHFTK